MNFFGSKNLLVQKILLALFTGGAVCFAIQEYNGQKLLAITIFSSVLLAFFIGCLFFLKKYVLFRFPQFFFRIIWLYGAFLLLNAGIFSGAHLVGGGDWISVFVYSGSLFIKTTIILIVFFLASALGLRILRPLRHLFLDTVFLWALSFGLGIAFFGLGAFLLALFQIMNPFVFLALVVAPSFFSWKEISALWDCLVQKIYVRSFHETSIWTWFIWMFIVGSLEVAFISAQAGPLVAGFDGFHQYLTFPTEYFHQGGFTSFFWHPSWGFPQLGEMIFLLSLVLVGTTGPFLVNFFLLFVFVGTFFSVISLENIPKERHWLTACIMSSPIVLLLGSGVVKIDLLFYFYCLLIFSVLRQALVSPVGAFFEKKPVIIVIGVLLGILFSLKYTAFFLGIALCIALFSVSQEKKLFIKQWVFIFGIAFLVMSPWLIKNWVVYKSPLYPIFQGQDQLFQETGKMCSQYFGQFATQDLILSHAHFLHQTGIVAVDNLQIFFFSLVYPSIEKSLFSPGFWVTFFLPVVLFALFQWKKLDAYRRVLILFSILFFVAWDLFLLGALWYLFPVFIALLLFLARQVASCERNSLLRWWIRFVGGVSIFLAVAGIFSGPGISVLIRYANGDTILSEAKTQIQNEVGPLALYSQVNDLLYQDESARVYSFLNPRGYFIDHSSKKFIFDYYGEKLQCFGETDDDIRHSLEQLHVKYIMITNERRFRCDDMSNPEENGICRSLKRFELFIERENLHPIGSEKNAILYEF